MFALRKRRMVPARIATQSVAGGRLHGHPPAIQNKSLVLRRGAPAGAEETSGVFR